MQQRPRVAIIGAGMGGLAAAIDLATRGLDVVVIEKSASPGGKMRTIGVGDAEIDAGPTVFTMRWVFEELFATAGASLSDEVTLKPADILARHAWDAGGRLDLFADIAKSHDAIGDFAGAEAARGYVEFCKRAQTTYETLKNSFILAANPTPLSLTFGAGLGGFADMWRISPFSTLWSTLGEYFKDVRLRQLFGRYATYCGSSPFDCPATLMLVAHVEREGVWLVDGGMHKLAQACQNLAIARGAKFRHGEAVREITSANGAVSGVTLASGEHVAADIVIANTDVAALANGSLGNAAAKAVSKPSGDRSLSAVTWALVAETSGFPLSYHNVFFSTDYKSEFDDIFRRKRLPAAPTVYVCAEDRGAAEGAHGGPERLFALVNAPATGDSHTFDNAEIEICRARAFGLLKRCGLNIVSGMETAVATTPNAFNRLFPGTGGALYGQASHGWTASFTRPRAKTAMPGLYVAGGSAHPGPGVPMAAISGRLAAARILSDFPSTRPSGWTATSGGTSMR